MTYLLWKALHILGAIAFLGNIITGLFWASWAHRQREFSIISLTFSGIIRSDRLFTMPGVWAILIGGFGAAIAGSIPILGTGWVLWPIILFSISGAVFGVVLAPMQKKIAAFTRQNEQDEANWATFDALYKKWEVWGLVAVIAPIAATVIMILKPSLPGL